ncbi:uncharacterized protein LOC62_06G007825 [Vanrija pseudolonga]|uniref:Uncharacterized protein n=1 Tax=Vanrija pseudolonga TaxID=143232 RepID=A0AAF0YD95_9TREE|nr:hypothetical protein LOC62_06G007825 [Vanrija pseudolonga]
MTRLSALVLALALGASLALGAPVPSSTSTDPVPSATPTPWRYPDTDESGICRKATKATCTKRRLALALGAVFGTLLITVPFVLRDGAYTRALAKAKALPSKMSAGAARIAAAVLAFPCRMAASIGRSATGVWAVIRRAAHATARLAPSRPPPTVVPMDESALFVDEKKASALLVDEKREKLGPEDDAKSVASAESSLAPSYVSDSVAPAYSPAVPPA